MNLKSQTWYNNKINSYMELESDNATGILGGTYHTGVGHMTAPLIGKFNNTGEGAFGWTVTWPSSPKYQITSQTSWVANLAVIHGVPTIEASWMVREQLLGIGAWITKSGFEEYTTTPPSEETIEAYKHTASPHPF